MHSSTTVASKPNALTSRRCLRRGPCCWLHGSLQIQQRALLPMPLEILEPLEPMLQLTLYEIVRHSALRGAGGASGETMARGLPRRRCQSHRLRLCAPAVEVGCGARVPSSGAPPKPPDGDQPKDKSKGKAGRKGADDALSGLPAPQQYASRGILPHSKRAFRWTRLPHFSLKRYGNVNLLGGGLSQPCSAKPASFYMLDQSRSRSASTQFLLPALRMTCLRRPVKLAGRPDGRPSRRWGEAADAGNAAGAGVRTTLPLPLQPSVPMPTRLPTALQSPLQSCHLYDAEIPVSADSATSVASGMANKMIIVTSRLCPRST